MTQNEKWAFFYGDRAEEDSSAMKFDRPIPHRCALPMLAELRKEHAGQGTIWNCKCGDRWRLVINVGRASWFNLGNEDKRWIGEM